MKQTKEYQRCRGLYALGVSLVIAVGIQGGFAYEHYSDPTSRAGNCRTCHGDFRGPTSTKGTVFPSNNNHEMHRNTANMDTECNLCHSGANRFPVLIGSSTGTANNQGIGCTGCHNAFGLRKHHLLNGVTECLDCHDTDGIPPAENVKPPYFGTVDTKARNPGNDLLLSNTTETWSIGDFLGLDNDGNNHYDLADYAIGPFRLLSTTPEGNDIRITYLTAGGRTNRVQASAAVAGTFANVSPATTVPGVGLVTNSYVEVGGATNAARFYRLVGLLP
jgi:hypothetical protein